MLASFMLPIKNLLHLQQQMYVTLATTNVLQMSLHTSVHLERKCSDGRLSLYGEKKSVKGFSFGGCRNW